MEKEKSFKLFSLTVKKIFNFKIKKEDIQDFSGRELDSLNKLLEDEFALNFGIAGKAGSGKTSTLNALFGLNEKVGHVEIGTTEVKKYTKELGEGKGTITFYDFPGLQDSLETDKQIKKDYEKHIHECDVVLWVISSRDRSLSFDEEFIKNLPNEIKERLVIGISHTDIIHPEDWNKRKKLPSHEQYKTIQKKKKDLSKRFNIDKKKIVEYCAFYNEIKQENGRIKKDDRRFNLFHLVKVLLESCSADNQFVLKQSFAERIFQTVFK